MGRYQKEMEDEYERTHYPDRYKERTEREYQERKEQDELAKRRSEEYDRWEREHSGGGQGVYST